MPPVVEARVVNALWTRLLSGDGADVGVGRRLACVIGKGYGQLWKIDTLSGDAFGGWWDGGWSGGWKDMRVSVGASPDGAEAEEVPWVVGPAAYGKVERVVRFFHGKGWHAIPGSDVLDVSAGTDTPPFSQGGVRAIYRTTMSGEVGLLYIFDPSAWSANEQGLAWAPVNLTVYGPKPENIAVERRTPSELAGAARVWFVRDDDQIAELDDPEKGFGELPGGASDLGAGGGVVWAVGRTESPDPGARGNTLWRLDLEAGRWDRVSPGWGVAVDVDADGNAWVIDSEGRLHVRGARMPAVAGNIREHPRLSEGELWDDYFNLLGDTIAPFLPSPVTPSSPGLLPETILAARQLGAGGTIELLRWDDFAANPVPVKKRLERLLGKDVGMDVLFCLAPIFTNKPRLPGSLLQIPGVVPDPKDAEAIDFSHPLLLAAYLAAVKDLSTIPGFTERVRYFSLGNEVDAYLGRYAGVAAVWNGYLSFCKKLAPEIRKILPKAKIGVNWTLEGIRTFEGAWVQMNESSDALLVNYYAIGSAGVLSESQYKQDLASVAPLAAKAGGKPIALQEIAMPSDPVLGGSEEKQAKFLSDVLEYWDAAGIQVRFLSWWQLHDYLYDDTLQVQLSKTNDVQVVQSENPPEANYYGEPVGAFWGTGNSLPYFFFGPKKDPQSAGDPTNLDLVYYLNQSAKGGAYEFFCRWLSSCGLRRADGSPKLAWSVYRDWTEARRKQT